MWISEVDDLMTNEKKDSAQFNSNPITTDRDFSHLKSPMTAKRPMVQRTTINLSEISHENAVVVSLSQKRFSMAATYAASVMTGVDESLFMAD